ncbi:FmdB family zinc ribbon protein [Thermogemmatispora sp.]|uniref:FmdB family zinc ribbon protein n=1 Tax=Thermogemmatispora sp. TaxID=1968838 RepID=UPI001D95B248|nr:zinc ribbon domain-containing protein [Thermogemmatispora sp.]
MPLYEYRCGDCKSRFELLVSREHADEVICVQCGSENVRRLLSIFAAQRLGVASAGGREEFVAGTGGSCGCGGGNCGCH